MPDNHRSTYSNHGKSSMKSLRETARKSGLFNPPISIKELGKNLRLQPPFSLLDLVSRPAQIVYSTGSLISGDVSGWADLAILSDGHWSFRGHLHDNGTIFGDEYLFVMALQYADASGKVVAVQQKGTLGAVTGGSRDVDWQQDGHDPFISDNWDDIRRQGYRASLTAGIDSSQIWPVVMPIAFIAMAILGASTAEKTTWGQDEKGNPYVRFERK